MTFGSVALWSSPVTAASLASGDCAPLEADSGTLYGRIQFDSISATIDGSLADGIAVIWSLVPTNSFGLTLTFYGDSSCSGNYASAPEDICFAFASTGWSPVLDAEPNPDDSSSYSDYYSTSSYGASFIDDSNNPLSLDENYYTADYPGEEYYMEWGEASPGTGSATFTMTLSQLNDDGTCSAGAPPSTTPGGWNIDDYRPIGIAESGALPNTL
jgi:hypothetical protein